MLRNAVLLILLSLPATLLAQTVPPGAQAQPVVVVVGEGVVKRTPDRAWVTIAAESRARTPREAQKLNSDAMNAVLQRIKAAGLSPDAVRTAAYDLQPEFDYANNRQTLRGYVARNTVEARVDDLPRLGEILEGAVGAGATHVTGVRLDVKDRDSAEREALNRAVADARARADAAAAGAGVKVERVVRIEEQREGGVVPMARMGIARENLQVASGAPPVASGEIEVRATVTLTAAIR